MHKPRPLNWNDLRYLLAVAREGSTIAAAKALRVNQSTVHRRLETLEESLGCALVERRSKGYRLTRNGKRALANTEQVETAVNRLRLKLASADQRMKGVLRVTCPVTVGHRILKSALLERFHARHPGLRVELLMGQRLLDLSKGEAEIAIRGGIPGDDALVGRRIAALPWGIYAHRSYLERHGRPQAPADLDRHRVIELIDEIENLEAARWMRSHAPNARIAARCSNIPSVHLAVRSGAGIAPLPMLFADADDDLVCVLGPIAELSYPMYLVVHKELRRVPRVSAFFEFCLTELLPVLTGARRKV